ncbi:hypothetical protein DL89DRAFT_13585 [Linderina pennispora]|uniref:Uncharacterized protein n=1 Tax=Linderina pennispora TaxID=61395 RepID=A0A1Y1WLC4_9FUNG|nr:uncharacterized protein DL89DRAFT_13585 [Linderina pennispora]ORX74302.1 hypothetical protein DL89DRAFT_13585 [Linderina pennispora]
MYLEVVFKVLAKAKQLKLHGVRSTNLLDLAAFRNKNSPGGKSAKNIPSYHLNATKLALFLPKNPHGYSSRIWKTHFYAKVLSDSRFQTGFPLQLRRTTYTLVMFFAGIKVCWAARSWG